MAQEQKRRRHELFNPKKANKRMGSSDFETLLDEIDMVEKNVTVKIQRAVEKEVKLEIRRCGLSMSSIGNQMGQVLDRVERVEKRVDSQEKAQEAMKCLSEAVVKKVEELHDETGKSNASIAMLAKTVRKLVLLGWNHDKRFKQLEEGAAVGCGNGKVPTGDGGKAKIRCSFCGKELTVKYLGTHKKSHCKKAAAAGHKHTADTLAL